MNSRYEFVDNKIISPALQTECVQFFLGFSSYWIMCHFGCVVRGFAVQSCIEENKFEYERNPPSVITSFHERDMVDLIMWT